MRMHVLEPIDLMIVPVHVMRTRSYMLPEEFPGIQISSLQKTPLRRWEE